MMVIFTGDARVDRSNPLDCWDTVKPYNDIKIDVNIYNTEDGTTIVYAIEDYPKNNNNTTPKN